MDFHETFNVKEPKFELIFSMHHIVSTLEDEYNKFYTIKPTFVNGFNIVKPTLINVGSWVDGPLGELPPVVTKSIICWPTIDKTPSYQLSY